MARFVELSEVVILLRAVVLPLFAALSSCASFEGSATLDKPKRGDLVGSYTVKMLSLPIPHRRHMKEVKLVLREDGTFDFDYRGGPQARGFVPEAKGRWEIDEERGLLLGSIPSWGVRFLDADGGSRQCFAWCLSPAPHELEFDHYRGWYFGDSLIMRRSE